MARISGQLRKRSPEVAPAFIVSFVCRFPRPPLSMIVPRKVAGRLSRHSGAERTLRSSGVLYLYGPYQINGRHTAQSNQEFDAWLRTQTLPAIGAFRAARIRFPISTARAVVCIPAQCIEGRTLPYRSGPRYLSRGRDAGGGADSLGSAPLLLRPLIAPTSEVSERRTPELGNALRPHGLCAWGAGDGSEARLQRSV